MLHEIKMRQRVVSAKSNQKKLKIIKMNVF